MIFALYYIINQKNNILADIMKLKICKDVFMLCLFIIITIMSVITLFVIAFSYVVKFLIGIIIKLIRKNYLDKF